MALDLARREVEHPAAVRVIKVATLGPRGNERGELAPEMQGVGWLASRTDRLTGSPGPIRYPFRRVRPSTTRLA